MPSWMPRSRWARVTVYRNVRSSGQLLFSATAEPGSSSLYWDRPLAGPDTISFCELHTLHRDAFEELTAKYPELRVEVRASEGGKREVAIIGRGRFLGMHTAFLLRHAHGLPS